MKWEDTKSIGLVIALALLLHGVQSFGQGTFNRTIAFEGHPVYPPGSNTGFTYYYEDSMTFTPMRPGDQFTRAWSGGASWWPENGTAYLLFGAFDSMSGSRGEVSRFGLYSVDLSEFSTLYAFPRAVQFIGYRADGTTVTTEFVTDGIMDGNGPLQDYQTFYFDSRFADLVKFDLPGNTYALDNLVFFHVVPEPRTYGLVVLGLLVIGFRFTGQSNGSRNR